MNVVDIIILVFIIGAFFRGLEIGFVRQFFSTVGFIGGLWIGAHLQPLTIELADTDFSKSVITIITTLGCAVILLAIGEYVGIIIKRKILHNSINPVDYAVGSVLAIAATLFGVWLTASIFNTLPYPSAQQAISESRIVRYLNEHLPPAPEIIADIGRLIDPNGFPDVFSGIEPPPSDTVPQPGLKGFQTAIAATRPSVVRIAGQGCGGISEGSGFVIDTNLVATNAHVIAGIDSIYVQDQNGTHTAVPIWFDSRLDFAILRVTNLAGEPLKFDNSVQEQGTSAAVLGYPGGGGFSARSAAILKEFTATGRDIYGDSLTRRDIYELQADIIPGNSGGPLITNTGKVVGVVFAESSAYENIGYALTLDKVLESIQLAKSQNQVRDTSSCTP